MERRIELEMIQQSEEKLIEYTKERDNIKTIQVYLSSLLTNMHANAHPQLVEAQNKLGLVNYVLDTSVIDRQKSAK